MSSDIWPPIGGYYIEHILTWMSLLPDTGSLYGQLGYALRCSVDPQGNSRTFRYWHQLIIIE